jgi:hypothetical protein
VTPPDPHASAHAHAHTYDEGLRDGKIAALAEATARAHERIDRHEVRITAQERITYAVIGILGFLELLPRVSALMEVVQ